MYDLCREAAVDERHPLRLLAGDFDKPGAYPLLKFEAALLDSAGNTLVHVVGPDTDAFFNLTEGQPAALGAGVTLAGGPEWTIPAGVFLVFAGLILARVGLRIIW